MMVREVVGNFVVKAKGILSLVVAVEEGIDVDGVRRWSRLMKNMFWGRRGVVERVSEWEDRNDGVDVGYQECRRLRCASLEDNRVEIVFAVVAVDKPRKDLVEIEEAVRGFGSAVEGS